MTAYDPSDRSAPPRPLHTQGPPADWPPATRPRGSATDPRDAVVDLPGSYGAYPAPRAGSADLRDAFDPRGSFAGDPRGGHRAAEYDIPTAQWQSPAGAPGGAPAAWLDSPVEPGGAHASWDRRPSADDPNNSWGGDPGRAAGEWTTSNIPDSVPPSWNEAVRAPAAPAPAAWPSTEAPPQARAAAAVPPAPLAPAPPAGDPAGTPQPWTPPGNGSDGGTPGKPARKSPKMALVAALIAAALAGAGVGAGVTAALSGGSSSASTPAGAPGQMNGAPGQNGAPGGQAPNTQPSAAASSGS
ncbi:hypothetical protein [Actinoplanes sp. HUAS TT8]|uniref:hypothetical protein n=1 Tax=Actinoplanes sp. HUAS TT8 TaxID=3447453 RepID=UPI003F5276BD